MKSIFSRDDSLINLAAAVDMVSNGEDATTAAGDGNAKQDDGSSDAFGFIDFQS